MEYYDHNVGRDDYQRKDPGYREYKDQYGSYRTSFREENPNDVRRYQEYRNRQYAGRGNGYHRYNRVRGRGGYYRGDRDFRDNNDVRSDQTRMAMRNIQEQSYNAERKARQRSKDFESDDLSDEQIHKGKNTNSNRTMKQSNMTHHASHYEADSDESLDDDMDLEKELYPISRYLVNDDREEMLIQVFKVIRGPKLRAMLTSVLKDIDLTSLKLLCLEQLEGMSKKRIRAILAGEEMDDSSATEDEDGENGDKTDDKQGTRTNREGDVDETELESENKPDMDVKNEKLSDSEDVDKNLKAKQKEKRIKKHSANHVLGNLSGVVQFKSGGRSSEIIRVAGSHPTISSDSSEDDLETVIASGNVERKRKHELKEKITKTKKIGFKVKRRAKATTATEGRLQDKIEVATEASDNVDKSGKTLMELLELEMRARAIKALLGNKDDDTSKADKEKERSDGTNIEPERLEDNETSQEWKKDDDEELQKQVEEEKRLQKAREHLHISEAKKREEEDIVERKHTEIRNRLEGQQKAKEAEELEAKRKEEEEAERAKKAKKKQDEYEKFLLWKEERQRKKEDKQKFQLKRQQEDEWYTRQAVKEKERQMLEKEKEDMDERLRINKTTELKRNKIDRVNVSDEDKEVGLLNEGEAKHKATLLQDGNTRMNENSAPEDGEKSGNSKKTRRYRQKYPDEEGQLSSGESYDADDMPYESDDITFSEGNGYSESNTTLSETDDSEKDDEEIDDKRIEMIRRRRAEIRRKNRRRKPAADIEDGEVDSDGEHFEPMEESRDPKIRMILHHLPKKARAKKQAYAEKNNLRKNSKVLCNDDVDYQIPIEETSTKPEGDVISAKEGEKISDDVMNNEKVNSKTSPDKNLECDKSVDDIKI